MKKSETVFLTTIFPASELYLDDFFLSLQRQTSKDFDILVVNDGIKAFNTYKAKYSDLNIIELKFEFSPAKNREIGINEAVKRDYNYIVFGDSDDYFSENRIESCINALIDNEIVINELCIVGKEIYTDNFFSKNIQNLDSLRENNENSNVFGFSNIAVCAKNISFPFFFGENLIAVDWYFAALLLLNESNKIKFIKEVKTYYRQHDKNTVGMTMVLNEQKLELGLRVKQSHYSALSRYCKIMSFEERHTFFKSKSDDTLELIDKLSLPSFRVIYITHVNKNISKVFTGWWSEIITLEEFYNYENTIN